MDDLAINFNKEVNSENEKFDNDLKTIKSAYE